jgi:nitrous oxidase accessory protein
VEKAIYHERNILINKSIVLVGSDFPVLDGDGKFEIISVKANRVVVKGFKLMHSGISSMEDIAGIKIYNVRDVIISGNIFSETFFGIYVQSGINCTIENNQLKASSQTEQQSGNGIHCWKSDSMRITGNTIAGHRDGIYFEFVTNSIIWRNLSYGNIRYGLHFMFSHNDEYVSNIFRNNGAGVSVMFTRGVKMLNNSFEDNWGDGSYGLLLKEISDSYISGNKFNSNTCGIFMEGSKQNKDRKECVPNNGWGMRVEASCMENVITRNNFFSKQFRCRNQWNIGVKYFQ